jgi:uncharacterized protein YjbJ (UPF0337 family)
MAKSKERVLRKYRDRIAASGPEYEAGVQSPRRSWSEAYKAASERMKAEIQRALEEGRHVAGVDAVGDSGWTTAAVKKGAPRFAAAATIAAEGYGKAVDDVLAAADAAARQAQGMPQTTYEQRKQRALAAMDAIHDYWRSRRRR